MINWLLGDSRAVSSKSNDQVQGDYDFILKTSPSIPETNSNLNIMCYKSETSKEFLHIRVKWWRLKNGQLKQIEGVRGNTYHCEPSDLGAKIKAQISSLDQTVKGKAEVWFGPIKFDAGVKQTVSDILSKGRTSIGVGFFKQGKQSIGKITITNSDLFIETNGKTQTFQFSISDPRIEVSSRDTLKAWIRFNSESEQRLNNLLGVDKNNIEMSRSSRMTQRKIYRSHLVDTHKLLQVKFNNRDQRDIFIFSIKGFCAQRQMKSSMILERMQRLDLNQQELCKQFFEYQSLKNDIIRLDIRNKQLVEQKQQKVLDLRNMQQDLKATTQMYLQIIQQKFKNQLQLNSSFSRISQKHDEISDRISSRTLRNQNKKLKQKIDNLESYIQQLKSNNNLNNSDKKYQKGAFTKKVINPQTDQVPNMIELNKLNTKLREQNIKLKERQERFERNNKNLLTSFQQSEGGRNNISKRSGVMMELAHKMDASIKMAKNKVSLYNLQQSSIMDNSVNTETGMKLIEEKFQQLNEINQKLLEQNEKLLKQVQFSRKQIEQNISNYKKQIETLQKVSQIERQSSKRQVQRLKLQLDRVSQTAVITQTQVSHDNGQVIKIMQQLQIVTQQKQIVIRDIICLQGLYADILKQKQRLESVVILLEQQLNSSPQELRIQNMNLHNEINNLITQINFFKENQNNSPVLINHRIIDLENNIRCLSEQNVNLFNDMNFYSSELNRCIQDLKRAEQDVARLQSTNQLMQSDIVIKTKVQQNLSKKVKDLQNQLQLMKRTSQALNRSRDLSVDMSQYDGEMIELLRKEMDQIIKDNEKISEQCDSYAKQVRRLKQQNDKLKKAIK